MTFIRKSRLRSVGRLVILDDTFPSPTSPPRYTEFAFCLERFERALVYTTASAGGFTGATAPAEVGRTFALERPDLAPRVRRFRPHRQLKASIYYCIFLDVAARFLRYVERDGGGLVVGLYPGGSFRINEPASDAMLRRVCESPSFRKVIVTERATRDYVLQGRFCGVDQVLEGSGCMLPEVWRAFEGAPRVPKPPGFDIGFAARKYAPRGLDKGYDVFVEVAKRLAARPDVRFHVIGNFGHGDVDVSSLGDRITFHGMLERDDFLRTLRGFDLLLSPNAPNLLAKGAFDGFPTGCAIEAAQLGVPIFITDELDLNWRYVDGEEIVIISRSAPEIAARVAGYLDSPARLRALGSAGARALRDALSLERQGTLRESFLQLALDEERARARRLASVREAPST